MLARERISNCWTLGPKLDPIYHVGVWPTYNGHRARVKETAMEMLAMRMSVDEAFELS